MLYCTIKHLGFFLPAVAMTVLLLEVQDACAVKNEPTVSKNELGKLLGDKLYLFDERQQATVFVPELQLGKKGAFVCIHQHACTMNRSKTHLFSVEVDLSHRSYNFGLKEDIASNGLQQ